MKRTSVFITIFIIFCSILIILFGFILFLAILNLQSDYLENLKVIGETINGI